jgi:hypothetical protein
MFILPQFAQSVTSSFDNMNCSFFSYHHNLHIQLIVLLTLRNAHYVHNTRVCKSVTCSIETPICSLRSHHHSFQSHLLVLLTDRTANYVHITTVCTVTDLFYWHFVLIIMFLSPQFAQSVTCSFDTPNCSLCSYHHSFHSQVIVLLTLRSDNYFHITTFWTVIYFFFTHRTAHYVQITRVCTVSYLLYWHSEMLIMFTTPQFAQSVTCSTDTPNCSLCSYHHNLHIQLLVFW